MFYYHLRYNTYPPPGSPVEKEEWMEDPEELREQQMIGLLETKHQAKVSLIVFAEIGYEEYDLKISQIL